MAFIFAYPDMVYNHIQSDKVRQYIRKSSVRKKVFEYLTIGQNLVSITVINDIAETLYWMSDHEVVGWRLCDIEKAIGCIYDKSGRLV